MFWHRKEKTYEQNCHHYVQCGHLIAYDYSKCAPIGNCVYFKWVDPRASTGSRCERSEPARKVLTLLGHNNPKSERNNIRSIGSVMIESMEPETFILEPHFIVLKNADECPGDRNLPRPHPPLGLG